MKYLKIILVLLVLILFNCSCTGSYFISAYPEIEEAEETEEIEIIVPDILLPDLSQDDPTQTGACSDLSKKGVNNNFNIIEVIDIPDDLPVEFDLSIMMPPVRSQGSQGSCVAWATTYYLKSYQEKIQHEYLYASYENVMSPAFVYNQSKLGEDCGSGSAIAKALEILKTKGCNTWEEFPYTDLDCLRLPSEEQQQLAEINKINDYFSVAIPELNTDENYTLTNLIKTLILQKNPIVIGMSVDDDFKANIPLNGDGIYIYNKYDENKDDSACGHAMLIVGYDDELNAFKIVNSWGTGWGENGYGWINYNFFLDQNDSDFVEGFSGAFIAYDEE